MSFFSIQYVLLLFFFNLIKSFPSNFINIPVGVTTKKNIIPITIGAIKLPNKIPNLNQALFKGVSNLELNSPKTRKIIEVIKDQSLISLLFSSGHKAISKKTIKNTMPKFLFELIFISLYFTLS